MKTKESISLVLPAYNEEALLEATVRSSMEKLSKFTDNYEVIIVDDAGSDGTRGIADRLSKELKGVTVLPNIVNLGVGISILRGLKIAKGDLVLHNGIDNPFNIDDLETALPLLKDADIVIASRVDRSAHYLWRKITSLGNRFFIGLLFNPEIEDMNFIQIYRKKVLHDPAVINIFSRSPAFVTPELLIRARMKGYKMVQFKAKFHRRHSGKGNYGKPHDIMWTLYDMLRFRLKLRKLKEEMA